MQHSETSETLDATRLAKRARYEEAVSADWRYRQFFNFLAVSPSYRLAHLHATGEVQPGSVAVPSDFSVVQLHYRWIGPVYSRTFFDWWDDMGQYRFDVAAEPEIEVFSVLAKARDPTYDELGHILDSIDQYLVHDRPTMASPPTILMAVPVHPNRPMLLQAFNQLLNEHAKRLLVGEVIPTYQFDRNKIRERTVARMWRVLREKVSNPDISLWELGRLTGVYTARSSERRIGDDWDNPATRKYAAIVTSRELKHAYRLAEHVARGRFPCFDELPPDPGRPAKFDYAALSGILPIE